MSGRTGPEGPAVPARAGRNLLSFIDDLRRHGGRPAYMWREGVRWRTRTYGEVHGRILACARRLAAEGLKGGDHVLIQGPEGADWVEALLGTFRAGGVAVPLDAATPGDFRERIAGRVRGRFLLAPPSIDPPAGVRRIDFGLWSDAIPGAGAPDDAGTEGPAADDHAEVMFTSGTTGDPKGVVLTHGNLASDFAPILDGFKRREHLIRPFGRLPFLSTLPLSHMFGQAMNIFLALPLGFTVVFTPPRPREVLEAARRHRAWGMFTVPRLLDLVAADVRRTLRGEGSFERFEERQRRLERWPFFLQSIAFWRVQRLFGWRFRLVVAGGAPLPEPVQQFWERTGYLVVQGYGLTETAPIVSISNPFERRAGSVGRPLGIQEVRIGTGGEVLVRGPNVTPGYLGSGGGVTEDGWFRTGDVGEIDERGRLRIRGRVKDVIVTPEGENVHPIDVEAAFAGIPGVREASVFGLPFAGGDSVHAALLLEAGVDPMDAVGRANARLLPKQRVRGHTVWQEDDFPRTPTGKVRKMLLRDMILALERPARGEEAQPGGRVSASSGSVRRLVAEVARVRPDSLQETTRLVEGLGLGSLDLVELTVAMEEEFGVSLPEDRLAAATVGDLERVAAEGLSGTAARAGSGSGSAAVETGRGDSAGRGESAGAAAEEASAARGSLRMPRWARRAPVRLARRVLEETVYVPIVRFFGRPEVRGLEHLAGAQPPFLFVANHRSYFDSALFKTMLPGPLRGRIAPAMTTRYHRVFFGETSGGPARYAVEWFQVRLVEFLFHAWPLPETAGLRASLSYAGELADAGFSLLIFPEGRHVPGEEMEPFRKGIGIFARELRLPVVPAYVEGTARVLPDGAWWPRRGPTRLLLGAPIRIDERADAGEATRIIEAAVRALRDREARLETGTPQNTGSSAGLPSSRGGGGGGT